MSNNVFTLFASTYPNISDVFADLTGDIALNRNGTSDTCIYTTSSLREAVHGFKASRTYYDFRDSHYSSTYIYLLLDNGKAKIIDESFIEAE